MHRANCLEAGWALMRKVIMKYVIIIGLLVLLAAVAQGIPSACDPMLVECRTQIEMRRNDCPQVTFSTTSTSASTSWYPPILSFCEGNEI